MPHSEQKPKNENDPKEEDDLQWKMTFDGRQPSREDELPTNTTPHNHHHHYHKLLDNF